MSLTEKQIGEIKQAAAKFMYYMRPEERIRDQLDLDYRIEGQSVYIFEIRPQWDKPEIIRHFDVAKSTYVKTKDQWKIFWLRANLKWYAYPLRPVVKRIAQFFDEVQADPSHCFFG